MNFCPGWSLDRVCIVRRLFGAAIRWKWIAENPLADMKAGSQRNPERLRFIDRETSAKVLAQCPDLEWKILFSLSRFGGLRCPSEHLALRWGDIDFAERTIRVTCVKTAHHEGHGQRIVPMFPELYGLLLEAYEQAPEGSEFVITRYRQANTNLRTQFNRIINRAKLTPWPRLFHNLRATRATELAEQFPAHVVASWLGHSEEIAKGHYLQVTDAHHRKAIEVTSALDPTAKRALKRTQSASVFVGNEKQQPETQTQNRPVLPSDSDTCRSVPISGMGPLGPEHLAEMPENPGMAEKTRSETRSLPPDLSQVVESWPGLAEPIKAAIMALIGGVR